MMDARLLESILRTHKIKHGILPRVIYLNDAQYEMLRESEYNNYIVLNNIDREYNVPVSFNITSYKGVEIKIKERA